MDKTTNGKSSMLECYAVFEGGGAKGIAFAGALSAAEEQGINFTGYGGASSGAIIGLLACLGYSGEEIQSKLKKDKIVDLLNPFYYWPISGIRIAAGVVGKIKGGLRKKLKYDFVFNLYKYTFHIILCAFVFLNPISVTIYLYLFVIIYFTKGVFSTNKLKMRLVKYAVEKILLNYQDFIDVERSIEPLTFRQLELITGRSLKVIGTDIISGRFVEYSSELTPKQKVFEAVAASGAYPLFFRPTFINGGLIADGGLSCNMPSFVYSPKKFKKLPVFAFDLTYKNIRTNNVSKSKMNFFTYLKDLCMSAIDASNNIISDVSGGIVVPVEISNKFGTFDFNMNNAELDCIYLQGWRSSKDFFKESEFMKSLSNVEFEHQWPVLMFGNLNYLLSLIITDLSNYLNKIDISIDLYSDYTAKNTHIVSFASRSNVFSKNKDFINSKKYSLSTNRFLTNSWNNGSASKIYDMKNEIVHFAYPVKINNMFDTEFKYQDDTVLALLSIKLSTHYLNVPFLQRNQNTYKGTIEDVDFSIKSHKILEVYCLIIRNSMLGQQSVFHDSKQGIK